MLIHRFEFRIWPTVSSGPYRVTIVFLITDLNDMVESLEMCILETHCVDRYICSISRLFFKLISSMNSQSPGAEREHVVYLHMSRRKFLNMLLYKYLI